MATIPSSTLHPEDETAGVPLITPSAVEPETEATGPCGCESSAPGLEFHLEGIDNRERALPIRQGDLTRLLLAEPGLSQGDRDRLAAFGRILGATFHSEFYEKLRELKELYAPLDPDSDYVPLKGCTRGSRPTSPTRSSSSPSRRRWTGPTTGRSTSHVHRGKRSRPRTRWA